MNIKYLVSSALVTVLAPAFACASKLTFITPQTQYTLEITKSALEFHTRGYEHRFVMNPCNKALLEDFWAGVIREGNRLPVVDGKREPKRPHLTVDGKHRLFLGSAPHSLRQVPQSVQILQVREARLCAHSS